MTSITLAESKKILDEYGIFAIEPYLSSVQNLMDDEGVSAGMVLTSILQDALDYIEQGKIVESRRAINLAKLVVANFVE